MIEYKLIRSRRKSMAVEVTTRGVTVRAPYFTPKLAADLLVKRREAWILATQEKLRARSEKLGDVSTLSEEELKDLTRRAKTIIPERVAYFAPLVGVDYGRLSIRHQRTRWGSCSREGNLSFNCLLLLTPPEVLDSVVVHELCHRKEMNHSRRFYAEVLRVMPDYRKWDRWLKDNGDIIMKRLPEKGE